MKFSFVVLYNYFQCLRTFYVDIFLTDIQFYSDDLDDPQDEG